MIGVTKIVLFLVTASMFTGGALVVALRGAPGPDGGADYGLDTDGDGRFDWLVVRMDLQVIEANYYNVWATLATRDPFGGGCSNRVPLPMYPSDPTWTRTEPPKTFWEGDPGTGGRADALYPISTASVRRFFEAGEHTVALAFKGTEIGLAGVDGPYEVRAEIVPDGQWGTVRDEVCIAPGGCDGTSPVRDPQGWTWSYTTSAYRASEFEEPRRAIQFEGPASDQGLDADQNGLFDFMVVTAPVDVNLAGPYVFDGSLTLQSRGAPWHWVASTYGVVDLSEGAQSLQFRFNGADIWASGHSGTFDFALNVYYAGGYINGSRDPAILIPEPYPWGEFDVYGDSLCGKTGPYRHEQWEERVEPAKYTGTFADYGVDNNGDGLFDALVIEAEVEVVEANLFDWSGQLMSGDGSVWISGAWEQVYLDVGVHTLALQFAGSDIRRSGVDGRYRGDLNLVVAMRDPATTVYTAPYLHTDFDDGYSGNGTRGSIWIADLAADGSAIVLTIERGPDILAVVMEGIVAVEAFDRAGVSVYAAKEPFSLTGGGNAQSFTFAWSPEPGTYVIRATLESMWGNDRVEITVTV